MERNCGTGVEAPGVSEVPRRPECSTTTRIQSIIDWQSDVSGYFLCCISVFPCFTVSGILLYHSSIISSIKISNVNERCAIRACTYACRKTLKSGVSHVTLFSRQSPVFASPPGFKTEEGAKGYYPPLVKCGMERSTACMGDTNHKICTRL